MKKLLTFAALLVGLSIVGVAQGYRENQAQAKKLASIENRIIRSKLDPKALDYIGATKKAKVTKDEYVKKQPGYGSAAVSVEKMIKFRHKLSKSNVNYQSLSQAQLDRIDEKRAYISTTDSIYKTIYDKIVLDREAHEKSKK